METKPILEGNPIPLQRARASKNRFYDPQYLVKRNCLVEFKAQLLEQGKYDVPSDKGFRVDFEFYFAMPKSWSRKKKDRMIGEKHLVKCDVDNAIKFALDVLTGTIWSDDSQVYCISAFKEWADVGKTFLTIWEDAE